MKKSNDLSLEIGDLVVYPIYGVGEIENFDTYDIDGSRQDFILINFKQDKMKLKFLKKRLQSSLKKLSNKNRLSKALEVLAENLLLKDMWMKELKNMKKTSIVETLYS